MIDLQRHKQIITDANKSYAEAANTIGNIAKMKGLDRNKILKVHMAIKSRNADNIMAAAQDLADSTIAKNPEAADEINAKMNTARSAIKNNS